VTQLIDPGHAFEMTWIPNRAGNWLFHCHMLMHMMVPRALHPEGDDTAAHSDHDHNAGMGGSVIGLTVVPMPARHPRLSLRRIHASCNL